MLHLLKCDVANRDAAIITKLVLLTKNKNKIALCISVLIKTLFSITVKSFWYNQICLPKNLGASSNRTLQEQDSPNTMLKHHRF